MWLRFDHHANVSARLYRKTVFMERWQMGTTPNWHGNPHDKNLRQRMPMELACHEALADREGVVQMYESYHPDHVRTEYEAYLCHTEWAPHETLQVLIDDHYHDGRPIPEPFIWCLADWQARAGEAMQDVATEDPKSGEIVHRDWKPDNVFLFRPDDDVWPYYPVPKLGDYGLAVRIPPYDACNPRLYQGAGTEGYRAPEQSAWVDRRTREYITEWELDSFTNVYAFGLILWALVTREHLPVPYYLGNGTDDDTLQLPEDVYNQYSEQLTELIEWCTNFRPDKRPTWLEVRQYIDDSIDEQNMNIAMGAKSGIGYQNNANFRVITSADQYQLATARNVLPPPQQIA